jgi:G3E family GTPase
MPTARVILVGGFLGAGKTTLLAQAAQRLTQQGKRVGLLANDQAADLVDTEILKETGSSVEEVAGGCFCCRFPDMIRAMERLVRESAADVLLGEPVGSCTDLSATVMQPLKQLYGAQFELAPFSVLVDAGQVRTLARLRQAARQRGDCPDFRGHRRAPSGHRREALVGDGRHGRENGTVPFGAASTPAEFPDNVLYIYEKQLEEADVIVLNKADLVPAAELAELRASLVERFPDTPLMVMSARGDEGVAEWLDFLSRGTAKGGPRVGGKIAQVDYDTYAAGEAALGWMNASARLSAAAPADWSALAREWLENLRTRIQQAGGQIGHLKLYLTSPGRGHIAGHITSNESPVSLRGSLPSEVDSPALLLNARVRIHADALRAIAEACLPAIARRYQVEVSVTNMRSFFPGRPQPTHRYDCVV